MVASDVVDALHGRPCGRLLLDACAGAEPVWLVGGAVRDLLLGREPRELDVAVGGEVDALAAALDGAVIAHERFGTATVAVDACRYDLARTRTETYARPGALPEISPAGIEADLRRRDVTINAIAVALPGGELTAVPGALEDLRAGVLRVLHDGSFTDDPTRLWRVARYAARLGFDVEPHTRALAAAARPGAVSGERLGAEVRLALAEPDPFAVFEQVASLNLGALPEGFTPRPQSAPPALELLPADGRADLVALAACSAGIELGLLTRWLDHLAFTAAERDLVAAASRWVTGAPLRAARTPAQIARAARGAPVEAIALAGGENARRWIEELRHVRLEIGGDDLLAAGIAQGPQVGARLQAALDRKLDGELRGRDAELAAALSADVGDSAA
jgi:tRNA nucleotidyltransferase (CCA-adding enzyme)